MAPSNTFVAEVDASCRHKLLDSGDPLAGMSVTAADVRGDELGLLVYTSDAGGAVCWSGVEGAPPNVASLWDGAKADLGPTQLCLWFNKGHGGEVSGRHAAHAVAGQYGDDIASVTIEATVGGRIQATTIDGWFLAWWPGHEEGPTRFRILGLDVVGQPVADLVAARDAEDEDWPCSSGLAPP